MYVRIAIISCGMNVITTFFVQGRLLSFDLDCVHLCLLCEICIDYALGKIMGCWMEMLKLYGLAIFNWLIIFIEIFMLFIL